MRRFAILAAGVVLAAGSALADRLEAQAAAVTDAAAIAPGQSFTVALALTMPRDAYVYWRNPGDAGLPTTIRWSLPEGFEAGEIEWPLPEIFDEPPLRSFGYKNGVLLPVRIQAPERLDPENGRVELRFRADWLICREACVPGGADLAVTLPVAEAPRPDAEGARRIAAARAKVPPAAEGWTGRMEMDERTLTLSFTPPEDFRLPARASVVFLPYREGVVEPAAAQRLRRANAGFELALTRDVMRVDPGDALRGALWIEGPEDRIQALEIELRRANADG